MFRLLLLAMGLCAAVECQNPAPPKQDPEILNPPGPHPLLPSDPALSEIRGSLAADRISDAEAALRPYLLAHPNSADAHFLLGYILFRQQKPEPSLAEFTLGARYRNPSAYDLEVVACDYVLLKDYKDADKWFTKALDWNPSNIRARYYLGRAKYNENRFGEAVQAFEECLKLDPKNVKAEDNLGLSYEALGRVEDALKAYRTAIEWQDGPASKNYRPYLDLGNLLVSLDRPAEALPVLQSAALLETSDASVHRQLGKALLHLDRPADARKELETAVKLSPENAPTHFILAQVYRRLGLADLARAESEKYSALAKEP